jgi:hypothetical protein
LAGKQLFSRCIFRAWTAASSYSAGDASNFFQREWVWSQRTCGSCQCGGGSDFDVCLLLVLQPVRQDDPRTRVWLYPLLQVARSAAFTVVVSIEPAGIAALGAHVLSRWVPYQVYRLYARWPNARPELVRLISFVLLSLMIVCSLGLSILLTWGALALLLWNIFRGTPRHLRGL